MTQNYICYNNKFYAQDQPIFGLNRAMKYGDGVFETIRIVNGKTKYLSFHLERLRKGLELLEIITTSHDFLNLETCINQLIIRNEVEQGGVLRLIAHRAGLGKYSPETNSVVFYIEAEELKENDYTLNAKGLNIGISKKVKLEKTPYSQHKTLNAIPYVLAAKEKVESKFDELILLNNEGRIVEATSSNLFIVVNNVIITPPIEEGGLAGIMRRVVINKAKSSNFSVEVRPIDVVELEDATEIFITNSINGIQWVSSYLSKRYFKKIAVQLISNI